jgi:hypothetical protein
MNTELEFASNGSKVKVSFDNINEETGVREINTENSITSFITKDGEFAIEDFFIVKSINKDQEQKLFLLSVHITAVGKINYGDAAVIVTLADGTVIECTCFSDEEFKEQNFDSGFEGGMFSLINIQDPDLDVNIDSFSIGVSDPEKLIESNWGKLATTPVANIRVLGSEDYRDFIPNPNFTDFPAQNLFIEHLKALK